MLIFVFKYPDGYLEAQKEKEAAEGTPGKKGKKRKSEGLFLFYVNNKDHLGFL